MDWHLWCSCCAKPDTKHCQLEPSIQILSVINKHFKVIHQGEQLKLCAECREFLGTFVQFEEKCQKVQSMFEQISLDSRSLIDPKRLCEVRIDAGLDLGGIKIEADDDDLSAWENIDDFPNFEAHFTEDSLGLDDALLANPDPLKTENELFVETAQNALNVSPQSPSVENLPELAVAIVQTTTTTTTIESNENENVDLSPKSIKDKRMNGRGTKEQADDQPTKLKPPQIRNSRTHSCCLNLKCSMCNAEPFESKRSYQEHMRQMHPEEIKIFNCLKCEKTFDVWKNFKRHEVIVHDDNRRFVCQLANCGKRFKRNPSLQRHLETHSDGQACSICGLRLSSTTTLRRHMIVHSDTKDYVCNSCGLQFKRSKALKIHLIQHSGLRPYVCCFCPKTFSSGTNLRGHKKKLHPVELAEMEASGQAPPTVVMPRLKELQSMDGK